MIYVIISLASVGIILLLLSFFMTDKFKVIDEQIEQLSISSMQETYQLKKKVKILEEELLMEDVTKIDLNKTRNTQTPLLNKITTLHRNGASIQAIAQETQLSEYDIRSVINQFDNES